MTEIESAWDRFPGYTIDCVPWPGGAQVFHGDVLVADSGGCMIVEESDHQDQLYFPIDDVRWEHFTASDHHTVCPFKGEADYWSLTTGDTSGENVLWTYRRPFAEVAALEGYVAFYADRLRVELIESWAETDGDEVRYRFPVWGDITDLAGLLDVRPGGEGRFTSPPYPDPPLGTFLDIPEERRPRQVVEGGHLLGQAVTAAARTVPDQRVVSSSMVFSHAARFDGPLAIDVAVLRRGRTYSTLETRTVQHDKLCSVGLHLLDVGAPDAYRGAAEIPDVAGPTDSPARDFGVTGRDVRIVGGAYNDDPGAVGPSELHAWIRHRDHVDDAVLSAALLAQPITHWTIAASMRPHVGVTEAMAHVTLSTGPMAVAIAFHDDARTTDWLLYANPAIYAGRGHVQGQGVVFTEDGRIVASYSVHAMVRTFAGDATELGGYVSAM